MRPSRARVRWGKKLGGASSQQFVRIETGEILLGCGEGNQDCSESFTWQLDEVGPPAPVASQADTCGSDLPWNANLPAGLPWEFCELDEYRVYSFGSSHELSLIRGGAHI
jgi:hypothetical protein